jgi:hypothetical protein
LPSDICFSSKCKQSAAAELLQDDLSWKQEGNSATDALKYQKAHTFGTDKEFCLWYERTYRNKGEKRWKAFSIVTKRDLIHEMESTLLGTVNVMARHIREGTLWTGGYKTDGNHDKTPIAALEKNSNNHKTPISSESTSLSNR